MRIHITGNKERLPGRSRRLPDGRQGEHPVFLRQRKVRTTIYIRFKLHDKQRTGFLPSGQRQVTIAERLLLAQHSDTVFSSVVIDRRGIHRVHQGESGNFPQNIFPAAASRHAVDLLHGHDIGAHLADHLRRTPEIGHIVHPSAVTDIITHNT